MPSFFRRKSPLRPESPPSAPPSATVHLHGPRAPLEVQSRPDDDGVGGSGAHDAATDDAASCRASASACAGGIRSWLADAAWPGMGLFGESYVVFSLGTLEPLWRQIYPDCWGDGDDGNAEPTCSPRLRQSLSYSVVLGVILGMLLFGPVAARVGRRRGSLATAAVMASGASGLALLGLAEAAMARRNGGPDDDAAQGFLAGMAALLLFFGVGVGGEYPLSASSASERTMEAELLAPQHAGAPGSAAGPSLKQRRRGRAVQLVFTMQGMGIFCNALFLSLLLAATGQTGRDGGDGNNTYDPATLRAVSNAVYAVGAVVLWYVLISRYRHLRESAAWQNDKVQRTQLARNQALALSEAARRTGGGSVDSSARPVPGSPTTDYHRMTDGLGGSASGPPPPQQQQQPCTLTGPSGSSVSSLSAPTVALADTGSSAAATFDTHDTAAATTTTHGLPSEAALADMRTRPLRLLLRHYGVRLAGVSLCWMLWDVAFYGNKLFQSTFLLALTGEDTTTLLGVSLVATLNAFVALGGYFGAALLLDRVGRFRLQLVGFLLTGILFVTVGFSYERLSSEVLVALYLGSSFFGQLGPNATTFLLPVEVFPTEMRSLCHGLAAAAGKVGALVASVVFGRIQVLDLFLLSGYASFLACAVTFWAVPESNGLDLHELDRKWHFILDGRKGEYVGQANDPRYLSRHERYRRWHRRHGAPAAVDAVAYEL